MSKPKRLLHATIAGAERGIDRVGALLARGEARDDRVRIIAYAGYRNAERLRVRGRVVRFAAPAAAGTSPIARLRAMIALYHTAEIAGVAVRLDGHGSSAEAVSDDEGYFAFDLPVGDAPLPPHTRWESVTLTAPYRVAQSPAVPAPVLAPGTDGHWGVISDIDDTVVETGATDLLKNWRRLLLHAPFERLAVPGVASLYRAIASDHAAPARPFFYVSSSPWNLYGFIGAFMEHHGIPHGPMFLKDWGIDRSKLLMTGHEAHKLDAIREILCFYPDFRFLLVGDNGERDVEIYAAAVAEFGTRIAAVFIRDVSGTCREGAKAELLRGIEAAGVPTFCGAGFEEAVAIFTALDLDRPAEVAKAVTEQQAGG